MTNNILLLPILIPFAAAVLALIGCSRRLNAGYIIKWLTLVATAATLAVTCLLFRKNINFLHPWAGFGFEFSLRCYDFSSFIILAASFFGFLVALYSGAFLQGKSYAKSFYAYFLITLSWRFLSCNSASQNRDRQD